MFLLEPCKDMIITITHSPHSLCSELAADGRCKFQ